MSRARFILLSVIVDAVAFNAAVLAAYLVAFTLLIPHEATMPAMAGIPVFNLRPYFDLAPLLTLAFALSAYAAGLYDPERVEGFWPVIRGAAVASTLTFLLTLAGLQLAGRGFDAFPRSVILLAWPMQFVLLVGWRTGATRLTPIRWPEQRVLIVGTGPLAIELAEHLTARSKWGYRVIGLLARDEDASRPVHPLSAGTAPVVLGTVHELTAMVREHAVDRVIVASPVALRELVEDITLNGETGVRVDVVPELYEIFIGEVDSIVADIPLMEITHRSPQWYVGAKRVFDIAFAFALLVVLSPILLLAAIAILVTMGRPVLFSQERLGRDRIPFRTHKFRTMVRDAEAASGPVFATEEDPRITPVGRFLRTYRVDELPQLVNILVGEMSFVGPRPEREFFVNQFIEAIPGYRERFRIKPGATGLAQVSGGYATTPERKLKYDLIYMYHQNLLMDVRIVADTVRVVLTGRGAR
ncbi:MAG: sugar transferase [Coriobacteriia bacterium]|nr:sugar transferase [Coriobacteriia bacterium]